MNWSTTLPPARAIDDQAILEAGETLEGAEKALAHQLEQSKTRSYRINVIAGNNFAIVDDEVSQSNPETALATIQGVLRSGRPGTTKTAYLGGAGLFSIQESLKTRGGHIKYRQVGNKIVAIVSWNPERTFEGKHPGTISDYNRS